MSAVPSRLPTYDPGHGHLVRVRGRLLEQWIGSRGMVSTRDPEHARRVVDAWGYQYAARLLDDTAPEIASQGTVNG
jgi:hypothetical protein